MYIFLIPEEDLNKGYLSVEDAKAYNDLESGYKNVIINEDDIKKFKKIDKKGLLFVYVNRRFIR